MDSDIFSPASILLLVWQIAFVWILTMNKAKEKKNSNKKYQQKNASGIFIYRMLLCDLKLDFPRIDCYELPSVDG